MTVTYTHEVATGKGFGNFSRLLIRWRGSIYKVVLPELVVYSILYGLVSVFYRFWIKEEESRKSIFEKLVKYCGDYGGLIPISFVLGFYVSQIISRWWNQFQSIPWPDLLAQFITCAVHGHDDRGRLIRRTIMRYANLSFVLTMIMISPQAKSRFPTMEHLVAAGLLMPHEKLILDNLEEQSDLPKYWVPIIWASSIATKARKENRIKEDISLVNIITTLGKFRSGLGDLLGYDWVCIPLVYTQVVTLAVYLYFTAALFGKQFIDDEQHDLDLYVPVFLFLEFFFYMGWLKVAETMLNPFGQDDDDFEVNWLIDRNFTISLMIVDEMHQQTPAMLQDDYWDEVVPTELPYTAFAQQFKTDTHYGSAAMQNVPMESDFVRMSNPQVQKQKSMISSIEPSSVGVQMNPQRINSRTTKNQNLRPDAASMLNPNSGGESANTRRYREEKAEDDFLDEEEDRPRLKAYSHLLERSSFKPFGGKPSGTSK